MSSDAPQPDLPELQVGDEVVIDGHTMEQRHGRITAKSQQSYAVELSDPEHEGTIEYDIERRR